MGKQVCEILEFNYEMLTQYDKLSEKKNSMGFIYTLVTVTILMSKKGWDKEKSWCCRL